MSREPLKIAVLYDLWEEEAEPPPPPEKPIKPGGKRRKSRKKPKHDREEIFQALEKLGHAPSYLVVDGRDQSLIALARAGADLFFNLTESYAGDDTMDMNLAAYLDLLEKPYTGAGPHALYLAQDKSLAKKIFAFHGIRTPFFATSYKGKLDHSHDIAFPLIVKPCSEDGSIGIDSSSVVGSVKELMERIHYIHEEFDAPALIEEYIEGREMYVGVIGNDNAEALPIVELDLSKLPDGTPRIAAAEVKWGKGTQAYRDTKSAIATDLMEESIAALQQTAVAAYQALELRDYGRVDMRLQHDGRVHVIEVNPNPWLSSKAEFAMAARKSGRTYSQLVAEIVELAVARA